MVGPVAKQKRCMQVNISQLVGQRGMQMYSVHRQKMIGVLFSRQTIEALITSAMRAASEPMADH